MSTTTDEILGTHQERAKQLLRLIQRHLKVLELLNMASELKDIRPLVEIVVSQRFKVLVLGEFNRGKSTLINALLGEKVLPAYPIETTAIINEVKWGESKRARLYQGPKAQEVPVEELEKYVIVKKGQPNPYDKVELFWPLDLCGNGVEIIDSPGLNVVSQERMSKTYNYLPSADAVILVSDALTAGSNSEMSTVRLLKDVGHTTILFVCNKINLIDPEEQGMVKDQFIENFVPYTKGVKYIFFVNAKGALEGRRTQNERAVRESGIAPFEETLKDFLVNERGRIKLLRPAQAVRASVQRVTESLGDRKAALQQSLEELQQKVVQAEKRLGSLELSRQTIIANFENFRHSRMEKLVQRAALDFYRSQFDNIAGWASAYDIQDPIKLTEVLTNNSDAKQRVITEVQNALSEQMRSAFRTWEEETLRPLINQEIDTYSRQLTQQVRQFVEDFEQVRAETLQDTGSSTQTSSDKVETLFREILIQAGGYDGNLGAMDKEFGFGKMIRLLLPHGGVYGALLILFGWHPFLFLPIAGIGAIINMLFHKDSVNTKIKEEVGKQYRQQLTLSVRELADQVADAADQQFEEFQRNLDTALEREIQNFRQHLQNALAARKQDNVDQKLRELEYCRDELNVINGAIEGMIGQLAMLRAS